MTINDILTKVDDLKPNQYSDAIKIGWLNDVEGQIFNDIIKTHRLPDWEDIPEYYIPYTPDDINLNVAAPDEYADLYVYYLFAMIDFHNNEAARYASSMQMFNTAIKSFADWVNRKFDPFGYAMKVF